MVTGKLRLSLSTVSIPAIVDDAIETARSAIAAKKITLRLDLPAALDLVGDADRLRQVIWNLLLNAAKFTPIGGSIDVGARLDGGEVRIQVADTGVGIAPEHLGLVFQRFWQGEASMSKRHSGLGIGLALARHIVELHGGTIEVSSEGLGEGCHLRGPAPRRRRPGGCRPRRGTPGSVRVMRRLHVSACHADRMRTI